MRTQVGGFDMCDMKKGIIFDMDGTLWDSAAQVAESWNVAAKMEGYEYNITADDIMAVMGKPMDELASLIFKNESKDVYMKLLDVCGTYENEYLRRNGAVLYPELRPVMEKLKEMGYHLYIVSNCQAGYIEAFLDYYKFHDLFEDIECYGNNTKQKNENISLVVNRNNLDKAVYVGDIQGDYEATTKAGLPFIHAKYGFGKIDADVPVINSLSELPEIIKNII